MVARNRGRGFLLREGNHPRRGSYFPRKGRIPRNDTTKFLLSVSRMRLCPINHARRIRIRILFSETYTDIRLVSEGRNFCLADHASLEILKFETRSKASIGTGFDENRAILLISISFSWLNVRGRIVNFCLFNERINVLLITIEHFRIFISLEIGLRVFRWTLLVKGTNINCDRVFIYRLISYFTRRKRNFLFVGFTIS